MLTMPILAIASIWDIRTRKIPNKLILLGLAVGLTSAAFSGWHSLGWSLAGMMVGMVSMLPLYNWRLMGGGDVKLAGVIGVVTGFPGRWSSVESPWRFSRVPEQLKQGIGFHSGRCFHSPGWLPTSLLTGFFWLTWESLSVKYRMTSSSLTRQRPVLDAAVFLPTSSPDWRREYTFFLSNFRILQSSRTVYVLNLLCNWIWISCNVISGPPTNSKILSRMVQETSGSQ